MSRNAVGGLAQSRKTQSVRSRVTLPELADIIVWAQPICGREPRTGWSGLLWALPISSCGPWPSTVRCTGFGILVSLPSELAWLGIRGARRRCASTGQSKEFHLIFAISSLTEGNPKDPAGAVLKHVGRLLGLCVPCKPFGTNESLSGS